MHIAISGAQGTGKSTLMKSLKEKLQFKFFEGVTRSISARGFKINEEGTNETQREMMKIHKENSEYNFDAVYDRCALDVMVYTHYLFNNNQITIEVLEDVIKIFEEIIGRYDIIFYILPEFDIEDDGERSTSKQFRDDIVDLFELYIKRYNINVELLTGTVEKRVHEILKKINQ